MATDISAALPDLDLAAGTTITVTLDDAAGKITKLNVYGFTPPKADTSGATPVPPLFAYGTPV